MSMENGEKGDLWKVSESEEETQNHDRSNG
jgi:hypothetical protein